MTANAGRKPKPRALKLVEGRSEGKDSGGRDVKLTPGFLRLAPGPPEILDGFPYAKELWAGTVPELTRLQRTKPTDAPALAAYCLTWDRLCQAQRELGEHGSLFHENSQGRTRHPAVAVIEA